jgi:hypothetical protein
MCTTIFSIDAGVGSVVDLVSSDEALASLEQKITKRLTKEFPWMEEVLMGFHSANLIEVETGQLGRVTVLAMLRVSTGCYE